MLQGLHQVVVNADLYINGDVWHTMVLAIGGDHISSDIAHGLRLPISQAELVKKQVWHKDQEIKESHNRTLLKIPVHDDREIMMKVLQYGGQALVLGPHHLKDKVEQEIRSMHSRYDTG